MPQDRDFPRRFGAALRFANELHGAAKANTPEGEKLDVLVTLVQAYEPKHYAPVCAGSC